MLFLAFLHKITTKCNLRYYKTAPFCIITYLSFVLMFFQSLRFVKAAKPSAYYLKKTLLCYSVFFFSLSFSSSTNFSRSAFIWRRRSNVAFGMRGHPRCHAMRFGTSKPNSKASSV